MLARDLGVFHRQAKKVTFKEALTGSAVWIGLALISNGWIYYSMGKQPAIEFLTGYLIEKSLSVDNIFVFVLLFIFFKYRKNIVIVFFLGSDRSFDHEGYLHCCWRSADRQISLDHLFIRRFFGIYGL